MKIHLLLVAVVSLGAVLLPAHALGAAFDPLDKACTPRAGSTPGQSAVCQSKSEGNTDPIAGEDGLLVRAVRILAFVTGIISTIMIIIAGLTYVISNGSPEQMALAKKTIIYALVGLLVAVLAGGITAFLTNRLL